MKSKIAFVLFFYEAAVIKTTAIKHVAENLYVLYVLYVYVFYITA